MILDVGGVAHSWNLLCLAGDPSATVTAWYNYMAAQMKILDPNHMVMVICVAQSVSLEQKAHCSIRMLNDVHSCQPSQHKNCA